MAHVVDDREALGPPEKSASIGIERFLEEKVRGLGAIVRDAQREIAYRADVSREILARIYQQYLYLKVSVVGCFGTG